VNAVWWQGQDRDMTSAKQLVELIRDGKVTSRALVEQSLARIDETDAEIEAWAFLDRDGALARADEMDAIRASGRPLGALHGIPIGLKDIIDTKTMPTECGTKLMAGRQPETDAAIVERLLDAGAVIIGKTVTTEFAFMYPSKTHNPHNFAHSPWRIIRRFGSRSGCRPCADYHRLANQWIGDPASLVLWHLWLQTDDGHYLTTRAADAVSGTGPGWRFRHQSRDLGLICDVIGGYDAADPLSYPRPRPKIYDGAVSEPPIEPNFVWFEMPYFDRLHEDTRAGMMEVIEALGGQVETLDAEASFGGLVEAHQIIMEYQIAENLGWALERDPANVSPKIAESIERGLKFSDAAFAEACQMRDETISYFNSFFRDFDAILTPAAPGPAPCFEEGTGNPIFSTIWTLCGLPCVTLPLLGTEAGLPMGVQLVGGAEEDDRLLRTANWMLRHLMDESE
jgi:Asp-tRNA(Asn)/Glu-tRNA(Gln) amidotransferase A subunit family amidase